VRDAAPHCGRLADLGDVAQQHGDSTLHHDDGVAQLLDVRRATGRPHGPVHLRLGHESTRGAHVGTARGVHDLVEGDPARRHAIRIQLDLELAQVTAEPLDGRHTRHGEQAVLDLVLGQVAQRHEVRDAGPGLDGDLEDLVEPAGHAREQRWLGARGELDLRHALGDVLPRTRGIGVRLELDRDLYDPQRRRRAHAAHLRQARQRGLERNRDPHLELVGIHRRVLDDEVEHRRGQIGEHVAR
jgi:hypothetical protein